MHHSRMTQWETWSHTIYTQGPSLLSISNIFPRDLHIKVKHFSEYISLMIFQRLFFQALSLSLGWRRERPVCEQSQSLLMKVASF